MTLAGLIWNYIPEANENCVYSHFLVGVLLSAVSFFIEMEFQKPLLCSVSNRVSWFLVSWLETLLIVFKCNHWQNLHLMQSVLNLSSMFCTPCDFCSTVIFINCRTLHKQWTLFSMLWIWKKCFENILYIEQNQYNFPKMELNLLFLQITKICWLESSVS